MTLWRVFLSAPFLYCWYFLGAIPFLGCLVVEKRGGKINRHFWFCFSRRCVHSSFSICYGDFQFSSLRFAQRLLPRERGAQCFPSPTPFPFPFLLCNFGRNFPLYSATLAVKRVRLLGAHCSGSTGFSSAFAFLPLTFPFSSGSLFVIGAPGPH